MKSSLIVSALSSSAMARSIFLSARWLSAILSGGRGELGCAPASREKVASALLFSPAASCARPRASRYSGWLGSAAMAFCATAIALAGSRLRRWCSTSDRRGPDAAGS